MSSRQTHTFEPECMQRAFLLKAEEAQANADRKAKLRAQIDRLSNRLDAKLDCAKASHERVRREFEANSANGLPLHRAGALAQTSAAPALRWRIQGWGVCDVDSPGRDGS